MSQDSLFHATTILAVKKDGHTAVAGDGQVTMGNAVIMKNTARKVRRLYHGRVIAGFAGSVADAFALFDKFEAPLRLQWQSRPRSRRICQGVATRPRAAEARSPSHHD